MKNEEGLAWSKIMISNQEDERRGSGSVAVPVSRGTLVQGEGGRVIQPFSAILSSLSFS